MNKETMQKLAEVLGLNPAKAFDDRWCVVIHGSAILAEEYFTLERMMRLAIDEWIDMTFLKAEPNTVMTSCGDIYFRVTHNGSKEDAERALKEAIGLAVIAIKENE